MRIHEVCQATGLTKKAINWYEEQGSSPSQRMKMDTAIFKTRTSKS